MTVIYIAVLLALRLALVSSLPDCIGIFALSFCLSVILDLPIVEGSMLKLSLIHTCGAAWCS